MKKDDDDPAPSKEKHFPGLDGIRGLAIGLVLFSHSVIYDQFTGLRSYGLLSGHSGVSIFFVLSGYLITMLMLLEEGKTGRVSLRLFYIRRSLRLFPALWIYLGTICIIWIGGALPHHPWHSFISSLFYFRNLVGQGHETAHLWSLSIEEQFYVFWPLLFILLKRRNKTRLIIVCGLILLITLWRVYAATAGLASDGALYIRSDFRFDSPLYGCMLAMAQRVWPISFNALISSNRTRSILEATGLLGLTLWIGFKLASFTYPGLDTSIVSILSLLLVLSQLKSSEAFSLLSLNSLVCMGKISYGLYLWQQLFNGTLTGGFENIRIFPFGLIATFFVAALSYWLLEKPILGLKDRLYHKN
ncbi:acyltransferase [Telmatocola sphagniphila]|uniref:Acyltransferase n=1 Tax=Telmatocola sphagniphila TaxID=1123043 RepID=A0A8E6EWH6_9BACT|nr:acyltransferase [Telmatocola sphagniphila]QVL33802.1 acyltransferase [Telmatocola sphagniphila]